MPTDGLPTDSLIVQRQGAVTRLTINRPARANALDLATVDALAAAVAEARSAGASAIVVTGAGERHFCAGADLNEILGAKQEPAAALAYDKRWDPLLDGLAGFPGLTIAAINGVCIGGGLSVALACDLRLAVDTAFFAYPAMRNGVLPVPRDIEGLARLVGPGRASLIFAGGARVSAAEAAAWGLAERVLPVGDLALAIDDIVRTVATAGPDLMRATLALLRAAAHGAVEAETESRSYALAYGKGVR